MRLAFTEGPFTPSDRTATPIHTQRSYCHTHSHTAIVLPTHSYLAIVSPHPFTPGDRIATPIHTQRTYRHTSSHPTIVSPHQFTHSDCVATPIHTQRSYRHTHSHPAIVSPHPFTPSDRIATPIHTQRSYRHTHSHPAIVHGTVDLMPVPKQRLFPFCFVFETPVIIIQTLDGPVLEHRICEDFFLLPLHLLSQIRHTHIHCKIDKTAPFPFSDLMTVCPFLLSQPAEYKQYCSETFSLR